MSKSPLVPAKKKPAAAPKKAAKPKAPARAKKPRAPEEGDQLPDPALPLSDKDELFVQAYLANGLNATRAYLVVHPNCKESTARTEGCKRLAKPHISARVKHLSALRIEKFEVDGEELLRHAHAVATADARHLTEFIYFACRYCHGEGHRRQRTLAEFERDKDKHEREEDRREGMHVLAGKDYERREFDEEGGTGFNEWAEPAPDCPNCHGHGVGRTVIKDTRNLPPDAAILFAGVKEGKDGIEVKLHDKGKFSDMLFKHKGLFEADNAQQAAATSPEALAALAASMERGRAAQLEKLRERRGGGFTGD